MIYLPNIFNRSSVMCNAKMAMYTYLPDCQNQLSATRIEKNFHIANLKAFLEKARNGLTDDNETCGN